MKLNCKEVWGVLKKNPGTTVHKYVLRHAYFIAKNAVKIVLIDTVFHFHGFSLCIINHTKVRTLKNI